MSRKNVISPYAMFGTTGADMSQASTVSSVTDVLRQDNIGIIVSWTGSSPVGELFIEVFDHLVNQWIPLVFGGGQILISGNSGSHDITINQLPWGRIRARYAKTSGTGSLFSTLTAKQIGG